MKMALPRSMPLRRSDRRVAIALGVSLLLHAVLLMLQFGVPGMGTPGTPPPLTIQLASNDAPIAPPAPAPSADVPLPAPPASPAPAPVRGMRLVDPAPAPPPPVPAPASLAKARPTVKKGKPRRARRVSTPMPARDVQIDPTAVIAQDRLLNDFAMPVARPEEAPEKSLDLQAAREGEEDGDADTVAASEEKEALAGQARAEEEARLARLEEQRLLDEETLRLAQQQAERIARETEEQARKDEQRLAAEQQRLAQQRADQQRVDQERLARQRLDEQQLAQQKAAEQERVAQMKAAEQERAAQQNAAEQARLAQQKAAEQERAAQRAAEQQRLAQQKAAEQERVAQQQAAEQQRLAQQKAAEQERVAQQKAAEQERVAQQQAAEQQRLAQQQQLEQAAARERLAQQERQRQQAQADRLAAERAGQLAAQRARENAAGPTGSGSSDGLSPGPGGSGARGQLPRDALGSDLANRARDLVKGIGVLKGDPPGQLLRNDRRVAVGANERDLPLKMYAESWRQKIERNASVNFPRSWADAAPRDIVVSVALRSDGSVDDVYIVSSSGVPEMDEAVRRIVRVNARYSPFPAAIAQRYDIIDVRRVWRFGEQLKLMEEVR